MSNGKIPSIDPDIRLYGEIDDEMYEDFYKQLKEAENKDGPIILCLTTPGGEADAVRRMALEIRLSHEKKGKEIYFLGKTLVYSAGIVLMSAFPKQYRFLTDDAVLLIHERRLKKEVKFDGPMRNNIETAEELLAQFKNAQMIEKRDYAALSKGSHMSADEVIEKAMSNWYVTAQEALDIGFIAGIV